MATRRRPGELARRVGGDAQAVHASYRTDPAGVEERPAAPRLCKQLSVAVAFCWRQSDRLARDAPAPDACLPERSATVHSPTVWVWLVPAAYPPVSIQEALMASPMTRAAIADAVSKVPLFGILSRDELARVAARSVSKTYPRHARVFEEGSAADCCYVMVSGRARVTLPGSGDSTVVLGVVRPNGLVGELALVDRQKRSAAVEVLKESVFVVIPADVFNSLRANPEFEARLIAQVAATVRATNQHLRAISAPTILARVAWCLLNIADQEGEPRGATVVIPRRTHQDLAELVGCARETVTRKIADLKRRKCLFETAGVMHLNRDCLHGVARTEILLPQVNEL
jgi:CRP/FNR family cyclic AMP-dependent transcriptional regulator